MSESLPSGHCWPTSVDVLGFSVAAGSPGESLARIDAMLRDPWDGSCRHVVTLNPEYVVAARRQADFAEAIRDADLVTADGAGVVLATRLLGGRSARNAARLTGVDLCEEIARLSGERAAPLFLLGAAPGVADDAAAMLMRRHPGCAIAGVWSTASPNPSDDDDTLARIAVSRARVVLVAYGAPAQVLWIERNRVRLAGAGIRLAIGIGGSFDYISGRTPRAPRLMRRIGLEWLYRLGREPRRWRRQLALPKFAGLVLLAWVRRDRFGREG